jgi:hypothetical protein
MHRNKLCAIATGLRRVPGAKVVNAGWSKESPHESYKILKPYLIVAIVKFSNQKLLVKKIYVAENSFAPRGHDRSQSHSRTEEEIMTINLKGIEALIKHERFVTVAIGVGGAIALAIIGYLLGWISS